MEIYKKLEIKNNESKFDDNFGINHLYNINDIQKENEKKFDTLLDGLLFNRTTIRNRGNLN